MRLERRGGHRLHILSLRHDDHEFLVVDEILNRDLAFVVGDLADSVGCEGVADRAQLLLDDCPQLRIVGEDRLEFGDAGPEVVKFLLDIDPAEPRQLAQLHVEDVNGLSLGELIRLIHEAGLGGRRVLAAADEGDDLVDDVEGLHAALEDVLTTAGLVEAKVGTSSDDFDLVTDIAVDRVTKVHRARHTIDERDHVDRETRLELGQLEQVVENNVGVGVLLEGDDEVGLSSRGAVVDVGDAVDVARLDQFGDAAGDRGATRLVGQLRDDDLVAPVLALIDTCGRPHLHRTTTGAIGIDDAGTAED